MFFFFLCGAADFVKPFMLKGLTNPVFGADGEERDPTKGTHKTTTNTLDVFSLD